MTPTEASVQAKLDTIRAQIAAVAMGAGRNPTDVQLIAVSKTKPIDDIRVAFAAGQRAFGENYVQEAVEKAQALAELPIEWHFIGSLQSNKAKAVAAHMHWFHGVDRLSIAQALSKACDGRPEALGPLKVLIQVNISGEATKHGVEPESALEFANVVGTLPGLELRGLMGMAQPTDDEALQRVEFARLQDCLLAINAAKVTSKPLDVLSMGMSGDLRAAIQCGATHVRIGSAIFGARG